jgi:hypothetical protein
VHASAASRWLARRGRAPCPSYSRRASGLKAEALLARSSHPVERRRPLPSPRARPSNRRPGPISGVGRLDPMPLSPSFPAAGDEKQSSDPNATQPRPDTLAWLWGAGTAFGRGRRREWRGSPRGWPCNNRRTSPLGPASAALLWRRRRERRFEGWRDRGRGRLARAARSVSRRGG